MAEENTIRELKQQAKWSSDTEECKKAVSELSKYGESAIPVLEEILNVSAYQTVKEACIEAIKSARSSGKVESSTTSKPNENADTSTSKSQKKEEEVANVYGPTLADLPP